MIGARSGGEISPITPSPHPAPWMMPSVPLLLFLLLVNCCCYVYRYKIICPYYPLILFIIALSHYMFFFNLKLPFPKQLAWAHISSHSLHTNEIGTQTIKRTPTHMSYHHQNKIYNLTNRWQYTGKQMHTVGY